MKKLLLILVAMVASLSSWAQETLLVEDYNIEEGWIQFNQQIAFVEGESAFANIVKDEEVVGKALLTRNEEVPPFSRLVVEMPQALAYGNYTLVLAASTVKSTSTGMENNTKEIVFETYGTAKLNSTNPQNNAYVEQGPEKMFFMFNKELNVYDVEIATIAVEGQGEIEVESENMSVNEGQNLVISCSDLTALTSGSVVHCTVKLAGVWDPYKLTFTVQDPLAVESADIANGRITFNQKIAFVEGESATAAIMQGEENVGEATLTRDNEDVTSRSLIVTLPENLAVGDYKLVVAAYTVMSTITEEINYEIKIAFTLEPGSSKKSAIDINEDLPYGGTVAGGKTQWVYVTVPAGSTKDITVTGSETAELSIEEYYGQVYKTGTGDINYTATASLDDTNLYIKVTNVDEYDMELTVSMDDHQFGPGETKATAIDVTDTGVYTFDDETKNIWVKYTTQAEGLLEIKCDVGYNSQNEISYYEGDNKLGKLDNIDFYKKIVYATDGTDYYVNAQLNATAQGCRIKFLSQGLPTVTLNSNGLATFSAGYNFSIMTSGVKAYKAAVNDETITLTELEGYIPAGTGVILGGGAGTTVDLGAPAAGATAADVTGNDLKATTKADGSLATVEANSWALNGNEFLLYTSDTYAEDKAYLVHTSEGNARSMSIVFADGETTAVSELRGESLEQRDGKLIENGRIVILKNGAKYNAAGQQIR